MLDLDHPYTKAQLAARSRFVLGVWVLTSVILLGDAALIAWLAHAPPALLQAHPTATLVGLFSGAVICMFGMWIGSGSTPWDHHVEAKPCFWLVTENHSLRPKLDAYLATVAEQGRVFTKHEQRLLLAHFASNGGAKIGTGFIVGELLFELLGALIS